MRKRIALLYGGASSEHAVSVMGYDYVRRLIDTKKYDTLPVYIDESGEWWVDIDGERYSAHPARASHGGICTDECFIRIDAAIPLLHGECGEDGKIQGALATAGIPYVGADVTTSAICIDKTYTKAIAHSLGIPTLGSVSFTQKIDTDTALRHCLSVLDFPMFIKPRRLGSSVGAYPARDEDEFRHSFPLSSEAGEGLVTVERMLTEKREIECAFCEIGKIRIITPPGEILIDGFYGYGEKYGGKTKTAARAALSPELSGKITDYATALADALRLRHLARIDFFLSGDDVYFNEINTFPGFTCESLYPIMLRENGIDPADAISSFIEEAMR